MKVKNKKMSNNWEVKNLDEVCDYISRGISPKYADNDGLIVINQKCIRGHIVNLDLARLHNENSKQVSSEKKLRYGDILINSTGTGTLGRVAQYLSDTEATVDSHVTIVRPNLEVFESRFFAWALFNIENQIEESATGTSGQTELPRSAVKAFQISYPKDREEQKRIVKILDEKFGAIEKLMGVTEAQLADAKGLFESRLSQVFNDGQYEYLKLSLVCDFQNGFAFKSKDFKKTGVPVLRISNIQEDKISYKKLVYIDPADYRQDLRQFEVHKGELVIAMSGATTGKLAVSDAEETFLLNQRVGKFIPSNKLNLFWLYYFLSTKVEENLKISAGAAQPNLSTEQIKNFLIPLPELETQSRIVNELNSLVHKTRQLEVVFLNKLAELDELKKSYLEQAFSGKL